MARSFALRYYLDNNWNKPPLVEPDASQSNGVACPSAEENFAYADRLFVVSIAYKDGGKSDEISSILLMDSRDGLAPSREILEAVVVAIEHHLLNHCD